MRASTAKEHNDGRVFQCQLKWSCLDKSICSTLCLHYQVATIFLHCSIVKDILCTLDCKKIKLHILSAGFPHARFEKQTQTPQTIKSAFA